MERPITVDSITVIELFKSVALTHFYLGSPIFLYNESQIEILEFGLARLDKTQRSDGVDVSFLRGTCAVMDEPIVFETLNNYFVDTGDFKKSWLNMLNNIHDPSCEGKLWERCVPFELQTLFEGKIVSELSIFKDSKDIPQIFHQTSSMVQPSNFPIHIISLSLPHHL